MLIESPAALLRMRTLPRVLFFFGEEEFLIEETVASLIEVMQTRGVDAVDIEVLDGAELTVEQLIQRAESFPMISAERMIVVRHFDHIPFGKKQGSEQILFAEYLRQPSATTVLVLLATNGRTVTDELKGIGAAMSNPKQRQKAEQKIVRLRFPYRLLLEHAAWIEFPRLAERQLPEWIVGRFKAHGIECPPEVAGYLVVQVGTNLRELANEIAKIMLFIGSRRRVALEDVLSVAGASRVYNVFELQKAIGAGDVARALKILHYMVRTERQDLLIVTMLARYFFVLWQLDELQQTTTNHTELGRAVGLSPFFVPEYLAALKRYSTTQIEGALELLHTADVALKTTSTDRLTILERTMLGIMSQAQNKAPLSAKGRSV